MQEPRDDELILYYFGEAPSGDDVRRRLEASPAAAERYADLCHLLEVVERQPVPEPFGDYGARVWRRLEPRLAEKPVRRGVMDLLSAWLAPRRLTAAVSVAALVAVAFLAGRFWPAADIDASRPQLAELPAESRERILMVSVGEHLERSEILLVELANAPSGDGTDLSGELQRAQELLPFNRLYRQAARRSGQAAVAEVLDELERLLLELAHGGDLSTVELDELRQGIESGGILFRVQVVGSRVEREQLNPPDRQPQHRSPDTFGDA